MKINLMSAVVAACLCWAMAPLFAAITVSVNDVTVSEGQTASFPVTLSQKSKETIFVFYRTRNGTACFPDPTINVTCAHNDYSGVNAIALPPPLEFKPGEVSHVVTIPTIKDTCHEPDETFFLDLLSPTGPATIGKGTGTCTIIDNDANTLCCCQLFCFTRSSCCCGGFGEGIPAEASTPVGVPITYGVQWTVPPPDVWRSLQTMDVRLVGEDEEAILTVRWDEAANTFSLLNPGNGEFQQTDVPSSPLRFEGSGVALLLETSEVFGSGPTGLSVLLNLNLIFKPQAAAQTFRVEARITNDVGIEKGYDPVGTITVEPR